MSRRARASLLLAIATLGFTACQAEPIDVNPAFAIAGIDEVPEGGVYFSIEHNLYLADAGDDGLVALSRRSPFLGCTVTVVAEADDFGIPLEADTRFFDPCHGGQYDIAGRLLSGPGEEDLMRFPIEVIVGGVYLVANPTRDA